MTRVRTYSTLSSILNFNARFRYLQLQGEVGRATFGFDRYLNQGFYTSRVWRDLRQDVIARDLGCDLGVEGYEIFDRIYDHHMNPLTVNDILVGNQDVFNPEYLISTTHQTHNAIHYGNENLLRRPVIERQKGDTKLW